MSVTKQNTRNAYLANPGATSFPFDFKINDKSDLLVTVDGQVQRVDIDFTVVGVGSADGGSVIFSAGREEDEFVVIRRNMTFQRLTDYQQLGDLRSGTLNADIDNVVMMLQQLEGYLSQSLRLGDSYVAVVNPLMPKPEPFALLGWNSTATGLMNTSAQGFAAAATAGVPFTVNVTEGQTEIPLPGLKAPWSPQAVFYNGIFQDPGAYTVTPSGITFSEPLPAPGKVVVVAVFGSPTQITESESLTFKLQAADSVTRAVRDKLADRVSVKDFGATGDGVTDDTLAIQRAIDFVIAAGGGEVLFPRGTYMTGTLWVHGDNVTLRGDGRVAVTLRSMAGRSIFRIGQAKGSTTTGAEIKNVAIMGMALDGNKAVDPGVIGDEEAALFAYTVDTLLLQGLLVYDAAGYGIGLVGTGHPNRRNFVVRDCEIYGSRYDGIDIKAGADGILIENVRVHDTGGGTDPGRDSPGIDIRGSNVVVRDCRVWDIDGDGIRIRSNAGDNILVEGCSAATCAQDGFVVDGLPAGNRVQIANCVAKGNIRHGIRVRGGDASVVNVTASANENGLIADGSDPDTTLEIVGGTFHANTNEGIRLASAMVTPARVSNALCSGNGRDGLRTSTSVLVASSAFINNGSTGATVLNTVAFWSFTGSMFTDTRSTGKTQAYGLTAQSGGSPGIMVGCYTGGNATEHFSGAVASGSMFLGMHSTNSVRLGSHSAVGSETVTGFITIRDNAGNNRKIAVIS